jgi:hypothetical protein
MFIAIKIHPEVRHIEASLAECIMSGVVHMNVKIPTSLRSFTSMLCEASGSDRLLIGASTGHGITASTRAMWPRSATKAIICRLSIIIAISNAVMKNSFLLVDSIWHAKNTPIHSNQSYIGH